MAHTVITTEHLRWIDLDQPTDADIAWLRTAVTIHPLAIEEFATPTVRARAVQYHNGIFLAIHVPLFNRAERATYPAELDIILTDDTLVTGHTEPIYQLDDFFRTFRADPHLRRTAHAGEGPAFLLHAILEMLMESCFPRLDHIAEHIDRIEEEIFRGHERAMVEEISIVKRDILDFRRTIMPQRSIIESLLHKDQRFIPAAAQPYFHDLIGTNTRLWNTLESYKETIASLEDTNNALLSYKLGDQMRILTIVSAVILPPTLYASIIGINATVPLSTHPYGFWIHIAIMGAIGIATAAFFRWRRWI